MAIRYDTKVILKLQKSSEIFGLLKTKKKPPSRSEDPKGGKLSHYGSLICDRHVAPSLT